MSSNAKFVEILRGFLSHDGVVGGKDRWWTKSKEFDFLCDGGENEGEEEAKNVEERMERLLQELSGPDSYVEKASCDIEAVERGLNFIMHLGVVDENFKIFGTDIFQTCYDISATAEEPLRRYALLRTEVVAQMWLKHHPSFSSKANADSNHTDASEHDGTSDTTGCASGGESHDNLEAKRKFGPLNSVTRAQEEEYELDPDEVTDFIMGIYALERVGIGHDSKEEVRSAASKFQAEDFFGVPKSAFVVGPDTVRSPLEHTDFINALNSSYYASKVGIDIKVDLSQVLALLPLNRPYARFTTAFTPDDDVFQEYVDQLTMVFNLIHVLSNNGELRLSAGLLPLEAEFLSIPLHMERAIQFKDVHLVGEICHCLRVLGFQCNTHEPMARGLAFLRDTQSLMDGSWPTRGDNTDAYFRYHAAMCAISGLNPQRFRGFGPSDPRLYDFLQETRFFTRHNKHQSIETIMNASQDLIKRFGPETYLNAPIRKIEDSCFSAMQRYYEITASSVKHEVQMSAQIQGRIRLADILDTRRKSKRYSGPSIMGGEEGGKRRKRNKKRRADEDEWTVSDK